MYFIFFSVIRENEKLVHEKIGNKVNLIKMIKKDV